MKSTEIEGRKTVMFSGDGFRKSTYSNSQGACLEVKDGPVTAVRDVQNRGLSHLGFPAGEWGAVLALV